MNSFTSKTQAVNDNHVITKAYIDQFHQRKGQSRQDLGLDFCNEPNDTVKSNQDKDLNDKN